MKGGILVNMCENILTKFLFLVEEKKKGAVAPGRYADFVSNYD